MLDAHRSKSFGPQCVRLNVCRADLTYDRVYLTVEPMFAQVIYSGDRKRESEIE